MMMDFAGARDHILTRLEHGLDKKLCYHNLAHTLDVHRAVVQLCRLENIPSHTSLLLETAAYYHDSGMLIGYTGHEHHSIEIAKETLPSFEFSTEDIREICDLIQVTILPQKAQTHSEKIICDADLDSLGREDFFIQSFALKLEWEYYNIRKTTLQEWFIFELQFMEAHQYFTSSAISLRNEQKNCNLQQIIMLLNELKTEKY